MKIGERFERPLRAGVARHSCTVDIQREVRRARLPYGPCWYRYNGDGYGEHENANPFDGTGVGRPWPLLAGERAHYELTAGRPKSAEALLRVMEESTAGASRLIPEQVWDGTDIPQFELFTGKPSGSACPLVWAHAEYVKLRRSLRDGRIFDQPPQTVQRYLIENQTCRFFPLRFNNKARSLPYGKKLRIALLASAIVHWSKDSWRTAFDMHTSDTKLGAHIVDLPTEKMPVGEKIVFTFRWDQDQRWEGTDFTVVVE